MRRAFSLVSLVGALGCGPGAPGSEGAGGSSSTSGSSGGSSGSSDVMVPLSTNSEVSTAAISEDDGDFIPESDLYTDSCDYNAQDCPTGEKCMPYADDGGTSWNNTKCVPVMEDPAQPGEPCFVVGNGVSGIDNCDVGAMCWDTDVEDQGTCVAGCRGTADAPYCEDPAAVCWSTRVFTLCIKGCDPLEQDCPMADDLCIPSDHTFVCVLDASGEEGQVHDPCMFPNECDEGLYCVDSSSAAECDAQVMGCCQPFCDLDVPEPDTQCAGEGQQCVAWYAEGTALPGSEDIGICMVPK